jgi:methyl-accepting chemotaxis protein
MERRTDQVRKQHQNNRMLTEQAQAEEIVDERRRGLIRVLAWSEIGMLVLGLIVQLLPLVLPPQRPLRNPSVLLVFAIGFVAAGGILYLIQRKRTQAAAYGLIYSFSFIAFLSIVGTATSNNTSTALLLQLGALFFLVVLWAGLLIGPWSAFINATIGSSAVSIGLAMHSAALQRGDITGYVGELLSLAALVFSAYYGIAFATWFFNTAISRLVTQLTAHSLSLVHSGAVIEQEAALRVQTSGTMQTLAEHVAAAAHQQLSALNQQTQAVNQISTTVDELDRTAEQIASLAASAAEFATGAQAEIERGQQIITHALASLGQLDHSVQAIAERMQVLERRVITTEVVTQRMAEIADELRLLALNATIEAAGAGRAGARFGVVAGEVSRLAGDAQASAEETRQLLAEVRTASHEVAAATTHGHTIAREGATQAEQAAAATSDIGRLVEQATTHLQAIGTSTSQQRHGSHAVAHVIHELAGGTRDTERTSQETARAAAELLALAKQLRPVSA